MTNTNPLLYPMAPEALLSSREVSERYRLPEGSLRNLRVKGTGPVFIKIGRAIRYRIRDIEAWLEEQARRSTCDSGLPDVAA